MTFRQCCGRWRVVRQRNPGCCNRLSLSVGAGNGLAIRLRSRLRFTRTLVVHGSKDRNRPGQSRPYARLIVYGRCCRSGTRGSRSSVDQPRLLLVDDKPELLKSLSEIVRLHGYRVTEALGGRAALEMLDTHEYDVVLLDLIMPEVSGHDVLDFAESRNSDRQVHRRERRREFRRRNARHDARRIRLREEAVRSRRADGDARARVEPSASRAQQSPDGRAAERIGRDASIHRQQLARSRLPARPQRLLRIRQRSLRDAARLSEGRVEGATLFRIDLRRRPRRCAQPVQRTADRRPGIAQRRAARAQSQSAHRRSSVPDTNGLDGSDRAGSLLPTPTNAAARTSSAPTALRATFPSAKKPSRSSIFRRITTC